MVVLKHLAGDLLGCIDKPQYVLAIKTLAKEINDFPWELIL